MQATTLPPWARKRLKSAPRSILLPEDTVAGSHRNFVTNIMKGVPLTLLFAHIYGRKTSPDQGRSAPAHCGYAPLNVITPASTIAAQQNIGTGIALAYKMQRKPNVVVALTGEGATSLGFWHEAVNFAAVHKLPIIFVIENNGYAESVPAIAAKRGRGPQCKGRGIWDPWHYG